MKKIILALLLMGTICVNTFAQAYDVVEAGEEVDFNHSEVYLSAGMPSFLGFFSGMFVAIFEGIGQAAANSGNSGGSGESGGSGGSGQTNKSGDLAFSVTGGYNYYFNENFALGGYASYEKFSSLQLISAQAKITAQYGWEHFKIYHSLSGGILFIPGSDKPGFAFDLTYLGLKLDFKNWNVFVDASIPMTGIIKAGASFKF